MSFTDKLDKLSHKIRHYATGREFEEEGYDVRWRIDDPHPGTPSHGRTELTLERYKSGVSSGYDPNLYHYVQPGSEVWEYKSKTFDWVDEQLMNFGKSYPKALERLIDSLKKMPDQLCAKDDWHGWQGEKPEDNPLNRSYERKAAGGAKILLGGAIGELNNWSGETANVYVSTFGELGEFWEEIVQKNYYLAELLVSSAEAQLGVFVTARESVMNIAEKTGDALWQINESDGSGGQLALTIIGALVSATLPGVGGALVGAGFTITSALVDQAENGDDINTGVKKKGDFKISGETVNAVLHSMVDALVSVDKTMAEKDEEIRDLLREAYNGVLASRGTHELTFDKGTPPLSSENMGTREVSASPSKLKIAATDSFPDAAEAMLAVNATLAESGGNWGEFTAEIYGGVTRTHPAWIDLRDLLQDLTGANGQKLKHAGEVLLNYAIETDAIDEISADAVEKTYQKLDIEYSGTDHEVYVPEPDTEY